MSVKHKQFHHSSQKRHWHQSHSGALSRWQLACHWMHLGCLCSSVQQADVCCCRSLGQVSFSKQWKRTCLKSSIIVSLWKKSSSAQAQLSSSHQSQSQMLLTHQDQQKLFLERLKMRPQFSEWSLLIHCQLALVEASQWVVLMLRTLQLLSPHGLQSSSKVILQHLWAMLLSEDICKARLGLHLHQLEHRSHMTSCQHL